MLDLNTVRQGALAFATNTPRHEIQKREQTSQLLGQLGQEANPLTSNTLQQLAAVNPQEATKAAGAINLVGQARGQKEAARQKEFFQKAFITDQLLEAGQVDVARQGVISHIQNVEADGGDAAESREFLQVLDTQGVEAARALAKPVILQGQLEKHIPTPEGLDLQWDPKTGIANYLDGQGNLIKQTKTREGFVDVSPADALKEEKTVAEIAKIKSQTALNKENLSIKKDVRDVEKLQKIKNVDKTEGQLREQREKEGNIKLQERDAFASFKSTINVIDKLLNSEGLAKASGIGAIFPTLSGTDAANFEATLETLKSQVFLTQVQKMRGLGQLSDAEGKRLETSLRSLDLKQTDVQMKKSLQEIKILVNKGLSNLGKKSPEIAEEQELDDEIERLERKQRERLDQ